MTITGAEQLADVLSGKVHDAKLVFNHHGALIFPAAREHRDMKADGISYQDNYTGNALAAMLRRDAIEIRYHRNFDDRAVATLIRTLLATPELAHYNPSQVTYQGRPLHV